MRINREVGPARLRKDIDRCLSTVAWVAVGLMISINLVMMLGLIFNVLIAKYHSSPGTPAGVSTPTKSLTRYVKVSDTWRLLGEAPEVQTISGSGTADSILRFANSGEVKEAVMVESGGGVTVNGKFVLRTREGGFATVEVAKGRVVVSPVSGR